MESAMAFSALLAACDSLIVLAALAAVVSPRRAPALIVLFTLCDAAGSFLGQRFAIPTAAVVTAPAFLALWGAVLCAGLPAIAAPCRSPAWAYLLPPLLAIDNLVLPGADPVAAGLASGVMSALGFALGAVLVDRLDPQDHAQQLRGLPLVIASLLLWT
jgi:hypothetical protein